jgi:DNA recombination protein RmuC
MTPAETPAIPLLYVLVLIGIVAVLAGVFVVMQFLARRKVEAALAEAQHQQQAESQRAVVAETRVEALEIRLTELRQRAEEDQAEKDRRIVELEQAMLHAQQATEVRMKDAAAQREALLAELAEARSEGRELTKLLEWESTQAAEKLQILLDARTEMSAQFKSLATELLEEKSRRFTEQNQSNLNQLLSPLQERIRAFQSKVEEVYVNETRDRSALSEQVRMLTQLNNTLSQDTQNLTLALKGDRKAQGNWGEIILDDVLEKAGLLRDQHYVRQGGVHGGDGQSIPDVVIRLPGERFLVVDSKMTLPDYRAFTEADSDSERQAALKRHLASVRKHIKGLSEKQYQTLYDLKSLDFVVMFVPLEPAFTVAVTNDGELFQHAWEKNVLLVSPSTLLFVVRTVANLWRQEDLSRNAKDISARGAELYDKLVGFIGDLQKVGDRLQEAQNSFAEARTKLSVGRGNVIRQAEMLKKLGVKPSKALPTSTSSRPHLRRTISRSDRRSAAPRALRCRRPSRLRP